MRIPQSFLGYSPNYYSSIGIDSDELNPVNLRYIKNNSGTILITPFIFTFKLFSIAAVKLYFKIFNYIDDFFMKFLFFLS